MKEFSLRSDYDGLDLSVATLVPVDGEPKAVVQLVHGMTEHKGRYEEFMEYLAGKGFITVMHDHRGHGNSLKSDDDLGYFYSGGWKAMVEDVLKVTQWAKNEYPGLPVYLFGHSMGSMVVRSFTKRHDDVIDKLIVCGSPSENKAAGAGVCLADAISFIFGDHYRSGLLRYFTTGTFNKKFKKEGQGSWHSENAENMAKYKADPKCGFTFTANGYSNLYSLMMDCYGPKGWEMKNPSLPILFISGAEDPCRGDDRKFNEAVGLMKACGYSNIKSQLYPGMRHEILNETDRMKVYEDVVAFLSGGNMEK